MEKTEPIILALVADAIIAILAVIIADILRRSNISIKILIIITIPMTLILMSVVTLTIYEIPLSHVIDFLKNTEDVSERPKEVKGFLPVSAGKYTIPTYLKRYIRYLENVNTITIDKSFSIQVREVTIGEFRQYTNRAGENNAPLEMISWREASEYAKWLSKKTKSDFRLPTYEQWIAACIKYGESRPILDNNNPVSTLRSDIDHLLGNLREWSSDSCGNGKYRLLGENYMTDNAAIGKGNCAAPDEKWAGVGFRLVKIGK